MSDVPAVSLVCCDLAGIVIDDFVVERAFAEAIATQGIVAGTGAYVRSMVKFDRARGRPPAQVLADLFCLLSGLSRDAATEVNGRLRQQGLAELVLHADDAPRCFP
jgi:hypothetical protein